MYYPPAIREDAPSNSEARDAREEIEVADPDVALVITSSNEPAKESDPSRVTETNEGQNPNAPQETIGSIGDAPVSLAEGPVLLVEPLQSVPLVRASKISRPLLLSSPRWGPRPGQRSRAPRAALVLYLLWCFVVIFLIFWNKVVYCNKAPFE